LATDTDMFGPSSGIWYFSRAAGRAAKMSGVDETLEQEELELVAGGLVDPEVDEVADRIEALAVEAELLAQDAGQQAGFALIEGARCREQRGHGEGSGGAVEAAGLDQPPEQPPAVGRLGPDVERPARHCSCLP
jgi:hypothetical protein